MTENKPFVSVIIPVYHDWHRLGMASDALNHQTWPRDRFEIIIVNNDPADPFPETFVGRQNLKLLCERKPGSYAARNTGIRAVKGELLGFCDADCIPEKDWIKQAVKCLVKNPGSFRVAGRIELTFKDHKNPGLAELHESIFAFRQDEYAKNGVSTTANMFAWRHLFDSVGMFDETLLSGGDLQWGQRAQDAGFGIVYCPKAVVLHPARNSVGSLIKKARRVCGGYIAVNNADVRKNPLNAIYHGFCLIKPPVGAGSMIFKRTDLTVGQKIRVYFLEYLLKIVQFAEYMRCQIGFKS
jgi:cellulose synthase/poly-beta-1,6-N-acetylglucosamine synthase-like glycosyltransferase